MPKVMQRRQIATLTLAATLLAGAAAAQTEDSELARATAYFAGADVVAGPTRVDCTLSGGTKTSCFSITLRPNPLGYTPGPWCPTNTADDASKGGIWFVDGKVVNVDGDFIANLADTFGDSKWQLFDPDTGAIRYTGTLEACEAAARPDVDPAYQNYCVQCLPEYMSDQTQTTYVIPFTAVPDGRPSWWPRGGIRGPVGVAANGVRIDGPAPVDAILGAYTLAPFDDCGGHVNLHEGYHYHAITDCVPSAPTTLTGADVAPEGKQIGIALDGYAIFANRLADGAAPADLDSCYGHEAEGLPYHYHAGEAGSNQNLGCHTAETGCALSDGQTLCDASQPPARP